MNKKQLICMWFGILAIVFFGFVTIVEPYSPDYANFCVWVFLVTLITGALILTFKDKKGKEGETRKPMNLRHGFQRITLLLAILVGLICGCTAIGILMDKRISAQRHLAKCELEFLGSIPVADPNERPAGWSELPSEKRPSYSDILLKRSQILYMKYVNLPLLSGEEDKKYREEHNIPPNSTDRFYTDEAKEFMLTYGSCVEKAHLLINAHYSISSINEFIGLLVLAGSGSAIAGFCGVWLSYFFVGLVYKLIKWLTLGFRLDAR